MPQIELTVDTNKKTNRRTEKCEACKYKREWECVHPSRNISDVPVPYSGLCELALVNKTGTRWAFERAT